MNIMLVTVTERTREIGLRKAIGARERDILFQFLVESLVMTGIGGVIGTLFGMGLLKLVSYFATTPMVLSLQSIFGAVFFSISVGLFFGFYPALKASRLDPIESLRYE